MRESAGWWLEWLRNFIPVSIRTSHKCFVKFLLVFDCKSTFQLIYVICILVGFNHLSMVIINPYNGLGLWFSYISNRAIKSCDTLLRLHGRLSEPSWAKAKRLNWKHLSCIKRRYSRVFTIPHIFLVPWLDPLPVFDGLDIFCPRGNKNTGYAWISPDTV